MDKRGLKAALWLTYLCVGIVMLYWVLSKLGGPWRHIALLAVFSAGVLLLIEAALLHGWIMELLGQLHELHDEIIRLEKEQPSEPPRRETERNNLERFRRILLRRRNWFLRVGASLALTCAGFSSLLCCPSFRPPGSPQSTVQFSDQVEKALVTYLANSSKVSVAGPPGNVEVRLDPGLEAALQKLATAGSPRWGILVLIAVTLGVLIGVIVWSLRKKPEAAPLTVAIATLAAVSAVLEKLVGTGQILPLDNVPWPAAIVAVTLLIVGIVLLFEGWRCLSSLRGSEVPGSFERQCPLGAAFLVFGFSAALLALLPPLLLHGKAVPPKPCPQPTTQGPTNSKKIEVFSLSRIDGLGDGRRPQDKNVGREKIQLLTADLGKNNAQAGDILLLLGSADCVATKPKNEGGLWANNEELAKARANWVKDDLQGLAAVNGIRIEPFALPQHAGCGLARNVRAVFPFLIHGEGN